MRVAWLTADGFRCHHDVRFEPDPGVNVLIGDNGAGKTSVLEAIGYLATLGSFRRAPDGALVADAAEAAVLRGAFSGQRSDTTVEVEIPATGRRRVLVNGKRAASRADLAEGVTLVAFLPDDLDLVKRGPALRREFLDATAVQLWPTAASDQRDFERALRQRNTLLRMEGRRADPVTLDVWDERVSRLGAAVVDRRLRVCEEIDTPVSEIHDHLGGEPEISWSYRSEALGLLGASADPAMLQDRLLEALREARATDMERRTTTVGPQRDELVLSIDGRDARTRASQGEQRSMALALRAAVHRVLADRRDEVPILLLDDVFSELDADRSGRLVEILPAGQVFVTSARADEVPLTGVRWEVTPGSVVAA